jgi:hypothetical protein
MHERQRVGIGAADGLAAGWLRDTVTADELDDGLVYLAERLAAVGATAAAAAVSCGPSTAEQQLRRRWTPTTTSLCGGVSG